LIFTNSNAILKP